MSIFDILCPEHGGISHIVVHESAHAVAALDRGIRFSEVRLHDPTEWLTASGEFMAGAVHLDPARRSTSARAHLEVALVGVLAERRTYGHALEGGLEGDIQAWRGRFGLTSSAAIQEAIGSPVDEVERDVNQWLDSHLGDIRRVALALAGVPGDTTFVPSHDVTGGRVLTEAEVAEVVAVGLR